MIAHIAKTMWQRRSANKWIIAEIALFLLVLFPVSLVGFAPVAMWLGLQVRSDRDVWRIGVVPHEVRESTAPYAKTMQALYETLQAQDLIKDVAGSTTWRLISKYHTEETFWAQSMYVTHEIRDLLKLDVVAGRWFAPGDTLITASPASLGEPETFSGNVVITQSLAEKLGGVDVVVGHEILWNDTRRVRVIGVVKTYYPPGDWAHYPDVAVHVVRPGQVLTSGIRQFWFRWTDDVNREAVRDVLTAVAPQWRFRFSAAGEELYAPARRISAGAWIGAGMMVFLLVMVGLGLVGVFWQKVLQRTQEIGIRRAVGGAGKHIWRQLLGEFLVLTTMGVAIALFIMIHIDWLNIPNPVGMVRHQIEALLTVDVVSISLVFSILLIYFTTFVCAWYPCRLATRVHPVEALHYE